MFSGGSGPAEFAMGAALSLVPVIVFLFALLILDSYKLLKLRLVLIVIVAGACIALAAYFANRAVLDLEHLGQRAALRYVTPLVEEFGKAVICVYLFARHRIGFMVDAAILGFAVGAGFACVENVYFLTAAADANMATWLVRGLGTAIMHGGATALFAVMTRAALDRWGWRYLLAVVPGLTMAYTLHSLYNHFLLPPMIATIVVIAVFPVLFLVVFAQSERLTRDWLGIGFDTDQELLRLIIAGEVSNSRVGHYLEELQDRFSGPVVADMLCWLRLHLELAIEAKGLLLMRQAGFDVQPGEGSDAKFAELEYLEESIGRTGLMAISPIVHGSHKELWQLHVLAKK